MSDENKNQEPAPNPGETNLPDPPPADPGAGAPPPPNPPPPAEPPAAPASDGGAPEGQSTPAGGAQPGDAASAPASDNNWLMILHLSQLANIVLPVVGIAAPIVIWQVQKDKVAGMEQHGKMVANFCILVGAILLLSIILTVVTCGFLAVVTGPIMGLLGIVWIVFAIIGGLKAKEGELWRYPGTIDFIK